MCFSMMSYWSWWKEHNTNKEKTKHSEIPNMCGILGNDRDVALVDFEVTKLHLKQGGIKQKHIKVCSRMLGPKNARHMCTRYWQPFLNFR